MARNRGRNGRRTRPRDSTERRGRTPTGGCETLSGGGIAVPVLETGGGTDWSTRLANGHAKRRGPFTSPVRAHEEKVAVNCHQDSIRLKQSRGHPSTPLLAVLLHRSPRMPAPVLPTAPTLAKSTVAEDGGQQGRANQPLALQKPSG